MRTIESVKISAFLAIGLCSCVNHMTSGSIEESDQDMSVTIPQIDVINPKSDDRVGSRLKPYYSVTIADDGSRITEREARYRDIKMNIDCAFMIGEDGNSHCLPWSGASDVSIVIRASDMAQSDPYNSYTDARCTDAMVSIPACKAVKYLLVTQNGDSLCPSPVKYQVLKVGRVFSPTVLYRRISGVCQLVDKQVFDVLTAGYSFYKFSEASHVSVDEFVGAEVKKVSMP